jgi:hypothetical protein
MVDDSCVNNTCSGWNSCEASADDSCSAYNTCSGADWCNVLDRCGNNPPAGVNSCDANHCNVNDQCNAYTNTCILDFCSHTLNNCTGWDYCYSYDAP